MKQLKPNDISVMRTAIGLYAQPFGVESFAVMLNEDKLSGGEWICKRNWFQ